MTKLWPCSLTATAEDKELHEVVNNLTNNTLLQGEFKPFKDELSVVNGVLMEEAKVVIPLALRPEMLRRLHSGHLGINKCKARARCFGPE